MLWGDMICVGHLGDSRICLVYITSDSLKTLQKQANGTNIAQGTLASRDIPDDVVQGNFVTQDHKPDSPDERVRVE